jgi:hypothetical protein
MKSILLSTAMLLLIFTSCKNDTKNKDGDQKKDSSNTEMNKTTSKNNMNSISKENMDPDMKKIAMANGYDNWDSIKKVNFTFNVDRGEKSHFERSWEWWPKENKVKMTSKVDTVTYNRDDKMDADAKKADKNFINDKYWLLFPFQLVWDKGFSKTIKKNVKAPISGKKMKEMIIAYNNKDGYTPGDMYKIYVDKDNMIQEWSYHPEGQRDPKMITTWEDYQQENGITYAKNHNGKDGKTKLYFSGVSFKK